MTTTPEQLPTPKRSVGRPRKPCPQEVMLPGEPEPVPLAHAVKYYASLGVDRKSIASYFGTTNETMSKWFDENEELQLAFDAGKEVERSNLHNVLYRAAINGNVVPAMFLLKAKHGYREQGADADGAASRVNIVFNIPAPVNAKEY